MESTRQSALNPRPDMKVIGLFVNADAGNQEALRQAGVDRLLTKEAAVDELYRAIQQTLMGVSLPLCLRESDPATDFTILQRRPED